MVVVTSYCVVLKCRKKSTEIFIIRNSLNSYYSKHSNDVCNAAGYILSQEK